MNRVIELVVSSKGETTIQTKGYQGASCLEASRFLERALGTTVAEQKTSEFYQVASEHQQQRQ